MFACAGLLVTFAMVYQYKFQQDNAIYFPRPLSEDDIKKYSNTDNAVLIFPEFTNSAYQDQGFYPHNGTKETYPLHDTTSFIPGINATYMTGSSGFYYLSQLHYPVITDSMVDQNPEILKLYHKIILLHNEYMTKKEFDAISSHGNVIYLYPNSAYAEVSVDYKNWTMSLVRGHGMGGVANGFNFVTSSKNEYDLNCRNYKWEKMPNGMQITCFPEFLIKSDRTLLQTIKDYPNKTPELIPILKPTNIVIPHCNQFGYCSKDNT